MPQQMLLTPAEIGSQNSEWVNVISDTGRLRTDTTDLTGFNAEARPAITLISGVKATGEGTKTNPYVIG